MNATVEIDKLGRLVVPKKMREALNLRAGDRLEVECSGDKLVLEREQPAKGLHMKDGWLVYDSGGPPISSDDVRKWVEQDREERIQHLIGLGHKR